MDAGIEHTTVAGEILQAAANLFVLFQNANLKSFLAEDISALQTAKATANNYDIEFFHRGDAYLALVFLLFKGAKIEILSEDRRPKLKP
jgi:hypothetical protein